jgi:hypothetical protein
MASRCQRDLAVRADLIWRTFIKSTILEFMGIRSLCALLVLVLFAAGCGNFNVPGIEQSAASRDQANSAASADLHADVGFATRQKFLEHFEKHGAEFGSITREEYLRQAQTLRDGPVGGDILELVRADDVITRFDRESGAFIAFNPDLTIRTYFKPNDGERYFLRQAKR